MSRPRLRPAAFRLGLALSLSLAAVAVASPPGRAAEAGFIAMHDAGSAPRDFERFPYARPNGQPGGRLTLAVPGTFDSLNPFPVKGVTAAQGISPLSIEPLMKRALDEPFTLYGLIAKTIETPDDRSFVLFRLDPRARFSDGEPVTAQDVRFSFELLRSKGRPNYRNAYGKVARVDVVDPLTIRFDLAGADDRELPLILGLMPVLPEHATDAEAFESTSFTPLVGSGPYAISHVEPGQSVTYRRNPAYWGADLPVNRGTVNFDEIRYDYYRDQNSMFEAFKAGLYDVRLETDPTRWLTGYGIPAVRDGRIVKEALPSRLPKGMSGFVFNTRRDLFADVRLREALGYLFDFEWVNRNLFGGVYTRTGSYFADSDLSAAGRAADARERALLAPFPAAVRPDILDGSWRPPVSDGSGRDRAMVRQALRLLREAGYRLVDGRLRKAGSEDPVSFEIMVVSRDQERLALNFAGGLFRAGIEARVRLVDTVQYERRRQRFDFDMMIASWPVSPSPGNEQYFRWGSASAEREASFNFAGARSPAIDAMIEAMLAARGEADFTAAVRAFDRVLLSGFYVVPLYHLQDVWIARSSAIARPARLPLLGAVPESWWRAAP